MSPTSLALAALVLLAGCTAAGEPEEQASTSPPSLAGTTWRLVEFQSMDDAMGTVRPEDPSLYTMQLRADSSLTMRLDCNRATGSWWAEASDGGGSGRFEIRGLAVTRALCPPPNLGENFAVKADFIRSFRLEDGRLHLALVADGGIFSFEPDPVAQLPLAPGDGGPRNWVVAASGGELELLEGPSTGATTIGSYPMGTVLDNLGTLRTAGRDWCDVQELGGGPRGFVPCESLEAAVSPDGSVATGPDDSALRAGAEDFDATGTIACAPSSGEPTVPCRFGVARAGGGYATVVVETAWGPERVFFFRMGKAIGAGASEAGDEGEFRASMTGDLHTIHLGDERYEVPASIPLGGGSPPGLHTPRGSRSTPEAP